MRNQFSLLYGLLCCALVAAAAVLGVSAQAQMPAESPSGSWVALRSTVVPDREHVSSSQFYAAPPGCGAIDSRAVISRLRSHSRGQAIADVLIDCVNGDVDNGMVAKLDFSLSNNFHDDNAITLKLNPQTGSGYSGNRGVVAPDYVEVEIDGEIRPLNIRGSYMRGGTNSRYFWLDIGMAFKASVSLEGRDYDIYFCEADGNTSVTDATQIAAIAQCRRLGDIVMVMDPSRRDDFAHPLALGLYDSPIVVGSKVYKFVLKRNGSVSATPVDTPLGLLQIDCRRWRMTITDGVSLYFVCGDTDTVRAPRGQYRIKELDISGLPEMKKDKRVSMVARISRNVLLNIGYDVQAETLDWLLCPDLMYQYELNQLRFSVDFAQAYVQFYGKDVPSPQLEVTIPNGESKAIDLSDYGSVDEGWVITSAMLDKEFPNLMLHSNPNIKVRLLWPGRHMMRPSEVITIDRSRMWVNPSEKKQEISF